MPPLDALPPDQRAVLQLVLKQGRSYEDIAGLLRIDADAVRTRAHAGLDAIAPDVARRLAPERRADVGDYLLGQQSVSARAETRRHLAGSAAARAWARVVADSLEPLARDPLPEIPEGEEEDPAETRTVSRPVVAEPEERDADREEDEEDEDEREVSSEPDSRRRERGADTDEPGPSRLGGALLLAGLGILVAVVIIVLVSGGNDKKTTTTPTTGTVATTPTNTSTGTNTNSPLPTTGRRLGQGFALVGGAILRPVQSGSKARAVVSLVYQKSSQGYGFTIRATNMPPLADQYYAVWLSNQGGNSELIGVVQAKLIKNGSFAVSANVPADVRKFRDVVLSREPIKATGSRPKSPTDEVVRGPLQIING